MFLASFPGVLPGIRLARESVDEASENKKTAPEKAAVSKK
jgi:hypothetical protein